MGKSRVAPLKQITIPRMQLTAATLAVHINRMVGAKMHNACQTSLLDTSTAVLECAKNKTMQFQTFVANRASVISEATCDSQWKYYMSTQSRILQIMPHEALVLIE